MVSELGALSDEFRLENAKTDMAVVPAMTKMIRAMTGFKCG